MFFTSRKACALIFTLLLWTLPFLRAQGSNPFFDEDNPVSIIGFSLGELISRYGIPRSVYAVRGLEEWQDDVVFVYEEGDFYIYKDRVWQAGFKAALGVNTGDSRGAATMALGPRVESRGNSLFYFINEGSWPLMVRCDFDNDDNVRVIFIYRTDF